MTTERTRSTLFMPELINLWNISPESNIQFIPADTELDKTRQKLYLDMYEEHSGFKPELILAYENKPFHAVIIENILFMPFGVEIDLTNADDCYHENGLTDITIVDNVSVDKVVLYVDQGGIVRVCSDSSPIYQLLSSGKLKERYLEDIPVGLEYIDVYNIEFNRSFSITDLSRHNKNAYLGLHDCFTWTNGFIDTKQHVFLSKEYWYYDKSENLDYYFFDEHSPLDCDAEERLYLMIDVGMVDVDQYINTIHNEMTYEESSETSRTIFVDKETTTVQPVIETLTGEIVGAHVITLTNKDKTKGFTINLMSSWSNKSDILNFLTSNLNVSSLTRNHFRHKLFEISSKTETVHHISGVKEVVHVSEIDKDTMTDMDVFVFISDIMNDLHPDFFCFMRLVKTSDNKQYFV